MHISECIGRCNQRLGFNDLEQGVVSVLKQSVGNFLDIKWERTHSTCEPIAAASVPGILESFSGRGTVRTDSYSSAVSGDTKATKVNFGDFMRGPPNHFICLRIAALAFGLRGRASNKTIRLACSWNS